MAEKLVTTLHLSREETDAMRDIAARLGFLYRTGPVAGKMGNPKAICTLLTEAYKRNPDEVYQLLEGLKK